MKENISKIKILMMDVDGTLTDGKIYMGKQGELMKAFSIKDGYAIRNILPKYDISPLIITGRTSDILNHRAEELGIQNIFQGIDDKITLLTEFLKVQNLTLSNVAVIGDDLNDYECLQKAGYSGCPSDACREIKKIVNYVCTAPGGNGAVREFIEHIIEGCN